MPRAHMMQCQNETNSQIHTRYRDGRQKDRQNRDLPRPRIHVTRRLAKEYMLHGREYLLHGQEYLLHGQEYLLHGQEYMLHGQEHMLHGV